MKTSDIKIGTDYAFAADWAWKGRFNKPERRVGRIEHGVVVETKVARATRSTWGTSPAVYDGVRVRFESGKTTVVPSREIRQEWATFKAAREDSDRQWAEVADSTHRLKTEQWANTFGVHKALVQVAGVEPRWQSVYDDKVVKYAEAAGFLTRESEDLHRGKQVLTAIDPYATSDFKPLPDSHPLVILADAANNYYTQED